MTQLRKCGILLPTPTVVRESWRAFEPALETTRPHAPVPGCGAGATATGRDAPRGNSRTSSRSAAAAPVPPGYERAHPFAALPLWTQSAATELPAAVFVQAMHLHLGLHQRHVRRYRGAIPLRHVRAQWISLGLRTALPTSVASLVDRGVLGSLSLPTRVFLSFAFARDWAATLAPEQGA